LTQPTITNKRYRTHTLVDEKIFIANLGEWRPPNLRKEHTRGWWLQQYINVNQKRTKPSWIKEAVAYAKLLLAKETRGGKPCVDS